MLPAPWLPCLLVTYGISWPRIFPARFHNEAQGIRRMRGEACILSKFPPTSSHKLLLHNASVEPAPMTNLLALLVLSSEI